MAKTTTEFAGSELNIIATLLLLLLVLLISSDLVYLTTSHMTLQSSVRALPLFLRLYESQRLIQIELWGLR